jgi:hypothetical protein
VRPHRTGALRQKGTAPPRVRPRRDHGARRGRRDLPIGGRSTALGSAALPGNDFNVRFVPPRTCPSREQSGWRRASSIGTPPTSRPRGRACRANSGTEARSAQRSRASPRGQRDFRADRVRGGGGAPRLAERVRARRVPRAGRTPGAPRRTQGGRALAARTAAASGGRGRARGGRRSQASGSSGRTDGRRVGRPRWRARGPSRRPVTDDGDPVTRGRGHVDSRRQQVAATRRRRLPSTARVAKSRSWPRPHLGQQDLAAKRVAASSSIIR